MSFLYHTIIYVPLYNALVFLMDILPGVNAGLAVLLLTVIVRFILFPLSYKSVKTQIAMRSMEPELNAIKQSFANDRQAQAEATMKLYKAKGVNPFSGFFLILIQLPIIFALYSIFLRSGLPYLNLNLLYSFVHAPGTVSMMLLGVNIAKKSVIFALCAALTQFFQIRLTMPAPAPAAAGSFKGDLARSMHFQMRYMMPVIIFFISYSISAAVALYWSVSNLFMIGQELYVRRRLRR